MVVLYLTVVQFMKLWLLGLLAERGVGRPTECSQAEGFDDFQYKYVNEVDGLPGEVAERLQAAVVAPQLVTVDEMMDRQKVMVYSVDEKLKALCMGRALNISELMTDQGNGFQQGRLHLQEYKSKIGGCSVTLPNAAMDSKAKRLERALASTGVGSRLSGRRRARTISRSTMT